MVDMPGTAKDGHEAAFHAALDGLIIHKDGRILEANPAAARMLSIPSRDLIGAPLIDFIAMEGRAALQQGLKDESSIPFETHVVSRGDRRRVMISMRGMPDGRGIMVLHPLTETSGKRRGADRDAELARLEQMNQFKTQLLNTAAHELNTPLTPLRLQVHLLASQNLGPLSERQGKAVSVLERNVERLSLLVSDILDVARLESGHLSVDPQEIRLSDLIKEAGQSYEETARGIGVTLEVSTSTGIVVRADPRRVLQVLYNLVSNGIKFTPEGGTVRIATGIEGEMAYVEVSDTGLGMDDAQMAALFQPFSRVHDTEATAIPGTGLGLYISKGIVDQHGGTMSVRSQGKGQGAAFRFTLPLADASARVVESEPKTVKSPMVAGPLAQRLRELI